jgi:hypothetical protein
MYPLIVARPHVGCRTELKTAGPGQTPLNPQATPNATDPATKRQSMSATLAVGSLHRSANVGFVFIFSFPVTWPGLCIKYAVNDGPIPKMIINASDGSNRDRSVRKAKNLKTLAESAIPEIIRPSPNSSPAR